MVRVRGKVEPRRIGDRARRLVSFSKRRNSLMKKALELAVLCDADVGVMVFSSKGKLSHFSSHASLEKTIQHYKRSIDAKVSVSNHAMQAEGQDIGSADQETKHGALEKVDQWSCGDRNIEQMNVNELTKLEEKFESMLRQVSSRKEVLLMDLLTKLREEERTLVSENQRLQSVVDGDGKDGEEEDERCGSDGDSGGDSSSSSSSDPAPPPSRMLQLFAET